MKKFDRRLESIRPDLNNFIGMLKDIYGTALKRVILFGSYYNGTMN